MDDLKSCNELEQEIIKLQHSVKQEKLKKAEELFTHRLVYSAIIFVIIFVILFSALKGKRNWIQLLYSIPFSVWFYMFLAEYPYTTSEKKMKLRSNPKASPLIQQKRNKGVKATHYTFCRF